MPTFKVDGILTNLITPFKDDTVDFEALALLVERQRRAGVRGVIVCGALGEGFALTASEQRLIIETAVRVGRKQVSVYAEVGTNATSQTVEYALLAAEAGADAIILPTPYYNRPSSEGVFQHVSAIFKAVELPLVLVGAAERSGIEITLSLLERFVAADCLAGYIETSGQIDRIAAVRRLLAGRVSMLIGNDSVLAHCPDLPVDGFVSNAAMILPEVCLRLWTERVRDNVFTDFVDFLQGCRDPSCLKTISAMLYHAIGSDVRLPLLNAQVPDQVEALVKKLQQLRRLSTNMKSPRRGAGPPISTSDLLMRL